MCCMQLDFSCMRQLQNPKFLVVIVGETPSQGDGGLSWLVGVSCKKSCIINLSRLRTLPILTLAHNQISLLHLKQMLDKTYIINYN